MGCITNRFEVTYMVPESGSPILRVAKRDSGGYIVVNEIRGRNATIVYKMMLKIESAEFARKGENDGSL